MKAPTVYLLGFVTVSMIALYCPFAIAQTGETTNPERSQINFQVLQGWKADLGDHALFLNRVAPPILPQPSAPPAQPPPSLSPEDARIAQRRKGKNSEVLFLSATVYDRNVTEVRMIGGHPWSAFSNIDFNLLRGSVTIETADTVYSLLLAVVNATTGEKGASNLPSLDTLSPTQAQYLVVEGEAGAAPQAKDLAALDALHVYFDANRQQLAEAYARHEAARIEEESRPKSPSPKPPDTVVNYWPGKNTVVVEGSNEAGK